VLNPPCKTAVARKTLLLLLLRLFTLGNALCFAFGADYAPCRLRRLYYRLGAESCSFAIGLTHMPRTLWTRNKSGYCAGVLGLTVALVTG